MGLIDMICDHYGRTNQDNQTEKTESGDQLAPQPVIPMTMT